MDEKQTKAYIEQTIESIAINLLSLLDSADLESPEAKNKLYELRGTLKGTYGFKNILDQNGKEYALIVKAALIEAPKKEEPNKD